MKAYSFFSMALLIVLAAAGSTGTALELTLYEHDTLTRQRTAYENDVPETTAAAERLLEEAESALDAGPFSVTFKAETPPSGDKRDYMSQGPYWWPNPDTEDGLPYIRRDGERNPEANKLDRRPLGQMTTATNTLALAYFFSGDERYAARAAKLLHVWFLSPETGMNPHLEYGQRIPGRTEGRGIGIIDTRSLMYTGDTATLLLGSEAWDDEAHDALKDWFRAYLTWLLESDHGKTEARHYNNHGTWYDAQVAAFALFAGKEDIARNIIDEKTRERVGEHIEPDGSQPHELGRTLPALYSIFNLEGFVDLAMMGARVGVDLWHYETDDGRSIRQALDYLVLYAAGEREWDYPDLRTPNWARMAATLRRAAVAYEHPEYEALLHQMLGEDAPRHRINLLYRSIAD